MLFALHRMPLLDAMGLPPCWSPRITGQWRRMRSACSRVKWFRFLPLTSRTCSWCTGLQMNTHPLLKGGFQALSWVTPLTTPQRLTKEASSKCQVLPWKQCVDVKEKMAAGFPSWVYPQGLWNKLQKYPVNARSSA